jgi:transposase
MFVGIDWANESHDICVVDPAGKIRGRATIAHSQEGFDELTKHLGRWAEQREILVGIERPEGRLVDRILEAGHPIVLIPTFAMKDLRRRYAVGGAKSDPGDAYVIADVTRTDGHRLRRLEPLSEETRALRSVVRARGDLVDQRVALGNQLRACLQAYWPGAAVIFADVCSEIALAFLERYPTPDAAARLGEIRLASFLKKAGYSGRRSAIELLERLRSAPEGIGGVEAEARADSVRAMLRVMRSLNCSIKDLDRAVVAHLGEHPDAEVFTSLPRSGRINAAQMLAEWGDCREAYPCPDAVSMLGGLCPVDPCLGQAPGRCLPVGLQQEAAGGDYDLRGQLPPRLAVGRGHLPPGDRSWVRSPARREDPGQGVGASHLALLAGPQTLRPGPSRGRGPS